MRTGSSGPGSSPTPETRRKDGDISAVFDVDEIDGQGWGVTIEPESGSDQPTGPVLFAGTI